MKQAGQSVLLKSIEAAYVGDPIADFLFVEESKVSDIEQHPANRLRDQRDIQDFSPARCVIKANLVPENRLAYSRLALHDILLASEAAPTENIVEAFYSGWYAYQLLRILI